MDAVPNSEIDWKKSYENLREEHNKLQDQAQYLVDALEKIKGNVSLNGSQVLVGSLHEVAYAARDTLVWWKREQEKVSK